MKSIYLAIALAFAVLSQSGCLFIGPILAMKRAQEKEARESKQSGQKPDPSTSASQAVAVQVEE